MEFFYSVGHGQEQLPYKAEIRIFAGLAVQGLKNFLNNGFAPGRNSQFFKDPVHSHGPFTGKTVVRAAKGITKNDDGGGRILRIGQGHLLLHQNVVAACGICEVSGMEQEFRIFVGERKVFPDFVKHQDILAITLRSLFRLFHLLQPNFIRGGSYAQPQAANGQYQEDFFHCWK
ncbi:MAG: hypothetical protein LUE13_08370 [Akkermansiaceae bacterium]|nr:hypothetical protein [Akkermansiaceae bacterium]